MARKHESVFDLAYRTLRKELNEARDIIKQELEKEENKKLRKRLLKKRKARK